MKHVDDHSLPELSDEDFQAQRGRARPDTVVILPAGPSFPARGPADDPAAWSAILEHGKRNVRLHLAGLLPIVCPNDGGGEVEGIGVFDAVRDDVERIMAEDPAVQAEMLTCERHAARGFAGSTLREPRGGMAPADPRRWPVPASSYVR